MQRAGAYTLPLQILCAAPQGHCDCGVRWRGLHTALLPPHNPMDGTGTSPSAAVGSLATSRRLRMRTETELLWLK